jgi:hypothetical protein
MAMTYMVRWHSHFSRSPSPSLGMHRRLPSDIPSPADMMMGLSASGDTTGAATRGRGGCRGWAGSKSPEHGWVEHGWMGGAWMDGWSMDGWVVDGWMGGGWVDGWSMDGWVEHGWMGGAWVDGWWMGGWVEHGWMGGAWKDGWSMDGWVGGLWVMNHVAYVAGG